LDQVQRYQDTIQNYPSDKMEKYGRPFLNQLQQKVADVDAVIAVRSKSS